MRQPKARPSHRVAGVALVIVALLALSAGSATAQSTTTAGQAGWDTTALQFRGKVGARYVYSCPAKGGARAAWGVDVYSDISSVCTAAVHAGRIGFTRGGMVTIEVRAGQRSHRGSVRNGVTTRASGASQGSFVVVSATNQPVALGWAATAVAFRGKVGGRYAFTCPAGGAGRAVWGTDVYTDDSSVCTAAVHAGRIGFARGGTVTVEMRAGQSAYRGSARNGVGSQSFGPWRGSFVFAAAAPPGPTTTTTTPPPAVEFGGDSWAAAAQNLRNRVGTRFAYTCPAGGPARTAWGTDVYTDDSSVCTAGVHAGRITVAAGGRVVIEIRPGQASYVGSTRNGITTDSYGAWGGSFVFVG